MADNVILLPNVMGKIPSKGIEYVGAAKGSASTKVPADLEDKELEDFFVEFSQDVLFILAKDCKQRELEKRGASFKYGLVGPFLHKFPFEDREHVPNSEYYDSDSSSDDDYYGLRALRPPNAHEVFLKFLKQVRGSNGYDVDCCPPKFNSPFVPIGPHIENRDEAFPNLVMGATHFAIRKINVETGRNYMFVKLDNVVDTTCSLILLTFSVKEEEANSEVISLRAMVNIPYGTLNYELEEWMFKPPPPTTGKPHKKILEQRRQELEEAQAKIQDL